MYEGFCECLESVLSKQSLLLALLQVISISANMIAMWGKEAQLYMAVNELGQVYATVRMTLC